VVWNIERLINDKTPGFHPVHYARHRSRSINIERAEKIDDGTVAIYTKTPDSLAPYNLSVWYMISKCAVEKVNYDYPQYAKAPAGTGPYNSTACARERLELVKNAEYWNPARVPSTIAWCCSRCRRRPRAPRRYLPVRSISSKRRRPTRFRVSSRPG